MYPTVRAANAFPRNCQEYAQHLGEYQARAFTMLWNLDFGHDGWQEDVDGVEWLLGKALQETEGIRLAPKELKSELFTGAEQVQKSYPESAKAIDINYIELFPIIADWQHEIVAENISAFAQGCFD